jgi:hypothetical protein
MKDSAQYGIWLGRWAQHNADIETTNTFSNNVGGNVFKQP